MHILIVAPEQIPVPPVLGGSVEICIYSIARKLAKHHQVTVISRRHPAYSHATRRGSLTIMRVPAGSKSTYLKAVLSVINGKSFDWIQVDNRPQYASGIKKHFPNTPVSLFLHSLTFVKPPYASRATTSRHLLNVDWVIANSSSLTRELSALFPKQRHKIHTIHLGTDVSRFRPVSAKTKERLRKQYRLSKGFHVLYAGRLIKRKGIPLLIKAVHLARKEVPEVKLLIAGGEQHKGFTSNLRKYAARLGVPARFLGNIPHRSIHKVYGLADCFVCPSQGHEAFGLVNVEAMASGLPVIASANGGINEVIRDGRNGVLIQAYRSPRPFAESIVAVARRKDWASSLAKQARIDAENQFSWQATARSLADFYKFKLGARK
ncbi:glycosyltransferase family 4 protein [Paenibacillus sedimenti]|uniref:Glycosyltransferase family 4 protein n=1 Tax=Paenibacillus sedimenti TaxID=2770274 RepID=A0A926QLF4_9BACL|nr:glycosyltransferase family 4 protein [Paenibacillus sedimenti]MBD0383560.1 glycosyltransferase family 4 protein [Paenibacillus sedimenti]